MLACSVALIQTYSMKFRRIKAEESFEYNLLGVGLIGCLTYHMLLFVPSLETVVHSMIYSSVFEKPDLVPREQAIRDTANPVSIEELRGTAMLYLVKCTLEVCQALLQFFFIVEASRRGPCCRNQARIKPGRSAIVFLLINNLALWLMNTFEFRESENQLLLHRQYYGIRTWPVITCCFIPLIIFFRFHSTVCFAQIWSKLYELH
ncbi:putative Otopetrin [Fasciola gigantica]|uniref:Putative Otopetrin n=1 Tax=Fasciola gigantica TaxID=46835 RepID=A0A504Y4Z1_FASGI|nr:putative Otopetrin [Fasciola gigantica]